MQHWQETVKYLVEAGVPVGSTEKFFENSQYSHCVKSVQTRELLPIRIQENTDQK